MSRHPTDTDGVRLFLYALAEAGGTVSVPDIIARTGLSEGSIQYTASRARGRVADLPNVAVRSTGRGPTLGYALLGLDLPGLTRLIGPAPTPLRYLDFTRSRALIARTLVEAGGEPVPARALALAAFPGSSSRLGDLWSLREAIFEMRKVRVDAGRTTGPVPAGDGGCLAYAWGTLAESDPPPTAAERPSVRVTLPSVAGRYVFAAGALYRDGQRCSP